MKLKEIAKSANTSVSTVSRVLNNKTGVGKEKRDLIEKLLIESGFYNNSYKIANDIKRIAVIVSDLKNPFFSEIVKKITEESRKESYQVLIFDTDENFQNEIESIDSIIKSNILGVIMCPSGGSNSEKNLKKLEDYSIPFVLFDRELDFYHDGVFLDDFKAGFLATEALIKENHSNIGILVGKLKHKNMYNRFLGYCHALKVYNIEFNNNFIYEIDLEVQDGYNVAKDICSKNSNLSAIFSCSNLITLGFIKYQNEVNKKNKISIIGFDNPDYFDILNLNISSITRSISEIGLISAKMLFKKLKNNTEHTQKIIINPILKLKGSEKIKN
ncbi:LacI family transcriptional regulator [Cetobacterium somerae]|uniref:LacI family DNA-binding transcriptional regulator n=1 Tax=Cetobacterium sp. NK01 TaxID=2993530 RepID=UPI002117059A|nr:LacI family DNA-binding transcriptional regulator [Cetobacterium sp. NK01]MCQ8212760.1 LacI family transcriptional regulator [Cetobacterium sp. NK01]